jgi:hypothetical protein
MTVKITTTVTYITTTVTYITLNPIAPTQPSGYQKNWPSRAEEIKQSGYLMLA